MIKPSTLLFLTLGFVYLHGFAHPFTQYAVEDRTGTSTVIPQVAIIGVGIVLLILDLARRSAFNVRYALLGIATLLSIAPPLGFSMAVHARLPHADIHDGAVQTEAALDFLAEGKNPYAQDYRETAFGEFPASVDPTRPNPAWEHYAYLPGSLLVSFPLYSVAKAFTGWYDQRLPHLAAFLLAAVAFAFAAERGEWRLFALITFAFHPLLIRGFIGGNNDLMTLAPVALSFLLLLKGKDRAAAVALGFALAMKQSAWLMAPFFIVFLFAKQPAAVSALQKVKGVVRTAWPALAVSAALVLPFFFWDTGAFIADTIRYPSGMVANNFPIGGFSIAPLLVAGGAIRSVFDSYPFGIIQFFALAPLFVVLIRWQLRENTVERLAVSYGLALLVFWFLSRFLFDNYLGYVSAIFLFAFFARRRVAMSGDLRGSIHEAAPAGGVPPIAADDWTPPARPAEGEAPPDGGPGEAVAGVGGSTSLPGGGGTPAPSRRGGTGAGGESV